MTGGIEKAALSRLREGAGLVLSDVCCEERGRNPTLRGRVSSLYLKQREHWSPMSRAWRPSSIRLKSSAQGCPRAWIEKRPLKPLLQPVSFTLKQIIQQFETDVGYIHFPTTALVSVLTVLEEDDPVEAATVGREGFIGLSAVLGAAQPESRDLPDEGGLLPRAGPSVPGDPAALSDAGPSAPSLHRVLVVQLEPDDRVQHVLHVVEAGASRWLLTVHDQAVRDEFPMTHEFLAFMLGVRRQTVTVVAGTLQTAGLIDYRRGTIMIRDRARLEETTCECYAAIQRSYQRDLS